MFPVIKRPVNWFALQINWLVSMWWGTLVVNGLILFRKKISFLNYLFIVKVGFLSFIILALAFSKIINIIKIKLMHTFSCLHKIYKLFWSISIHWSMKKIYIVNFQPTLDMSWFTITYLWQSSALQYWIDNSRHCLNSSKRFGMQASPLLLPEMKMR